MNQTGSVGPGRKTFWHDLRDPRTVELIVMVKGGASFAAIGLAVGRSRESISKTIPRMIQLYGNKIFAPARQIYSAQEAAEAVGIAVKIVRDICARGEITCARSNESRQLSSYRIDARGLRELRNHPRIKRERLCTICAKPFVFKPSQHGMKVCLNPECQKERTRRLNRRHYANDSQREPTLESLRGWRKDLWQQVRSYQLSFDEPWLTMIEVAKRTGLSRMQLKRLRQRKLMLTKSHPTKQGGGWPSQMMSAGQVNILEHVLQKHPRQT